MAFNDPNKHDFVHTLALNGKIKLDTAGNPLRDARGKLISALTDEQKEASHKAFSCDVVVMRKVSKKPDGSVFTSDVSINAHEKDSITQWQKLGYQLPEEFEAPAKRDADAEARARLKAELLAEVRAELAENSSKKKG